MAEKLTSDLIASTAAPLIGAITLWDNDPKARGFGVRVFAATAQSACSGAARTVGREAEAEESSHLPRTGGWRADLTDLGCLVCSARSSDNDLVEIPRRRNREAVVRP